MAVSVEHHDDVVEEIISLVAVVLAPLLVTVALGLGAMLIFFRHGHSATVLAIGLAGATAMAAVCIAAAMSRPPRSPRGKDAELLSTDRAGIGA